MTELTGTKTQLESSIESAEFSRTQIDGYSIVVSQGGAPARGSNGVTSSRQATGEYLVTFPQNVDIWLWLATLAPANAVAQQPGMITVELENMTTASLRVRTFNMAGAATDRPFHLHVRKIQ